MINEILKSLGEYNECSEPPKVTQQDLNNWVVALESMPKPKVTVHHYLIMLHIAEMLDGALN